MVRKQVYIEPRQEALLKRQARVRGVTEAELIREALDRNLGDLATLTSSESWQRLLKSMEARRGLAGRRRGWRRDDLYGRP